VASAGADRYTAPHDGKNATQLAAIVSADVVGYSRLMGLDEAGTLQRLNALRSEHSDPLIAKHGGRIVKTTGDGMLLEFPSVVAAVVCCVAVQEGLALRNANAGGVTISSNAHDSVEGRVDATFVDGGVQNLKNIARPIRIWR